MAFSIDTIGWEFKLIRGYSRSATMPCQTNKNWTITPVIVVIFLFQTLGYGVVYLLVILLLRRKRRRLRPGCRTRVRCVICRLGVRGVPCPEISVCVDTQGACPQPCDQKCQAVGPNAPSRASGACGIATVEGQLKGSAREDAVGVVRDRGSQAWCYGSLVSHASRESTSRGCHGGGSMRKSRTNYKDWSPMSRG